MIKNLTSSLKGYSYFNKKWESLKIKAPKEIKFKIYLNNKFFVSILATPHKLENLLIGFLYAEGIINKLDDIVKYKIDNEKYLANVILKKKDLKFPEKKILTSGFGKGVTFKTEGKKIKSNIVVEPEKIFSYVEDMYEMMELYKISGGVHASALAGKEKVLIVAEDIGRHNTFDKITGEAILKNINTKDKVILTTGRISTEMLLKASNMDIPIACTLKVPTENAISIGKELGITLVGHIKERKLIVFTYPERLGYN